MSGNAPEELTDDAFLGGRLRILQPAKGFRAGVDSVLLAAAVPAREGETVFEAGTGPGVAALCLLARVPGVRITGVEANPGYAELARRNAGRNHLSERLTVIDGDALRAGKKGGPAGLAPGTFDHAFANPPYHAAAHARPSPEPDKAAAHVLPEHAPLATWVRALARMVRPRGSITLIQPATALPHLLTALHEANLGGVVIAPIWPRAGLPATRVLVRARRGVKTPARLLPGLTLHEEGHAFTPEAEATLRHAAPFPALARIW